MHDWFEEDSIGPSLLISFRVADVPIDTAIPRRRIGFPSTYLYLTLLGLLRGNVVIGPIGATTAARCLARFANELFCFAFKRALPDVIQFDMIAWNLEKGLSLFDANSDRSKDVESCFERRLIVVLTLDFAESFVENRMEEEISFRRLFFPGIWKKVDASSPGLHGPSRTQSTYALTIL